MNIGKIICFILFRTCLILCLLTFVSHVYGQNEYIEIEFVDFQVSDTITAGGTITVSGTLKNNGNIPVEPQVEMLMEVLPSDNGSGGNPPTFDSDIENNFNNETILPNESQSFERQILVNEAFFLADDYVVIIWPRTMQNNDPVFANNVFEAAVNVRTPDETTQNKKLDSDPVIMSGDQLAESLLIGMPVDEVVGFRYDNGWQQIPIQIDELDIKDILAPYGPYRNNVAPFANNPSGRSILFYTDENSYTGADSDPDFDLNDELVFMYKDAGAKATATDYPTGVIHQTATEINVTNIFPNTDKYIYIFLQDGTLSQDADTSYVDYHFRLEEEDVYPDDFDFLNDEEEENSKIQTPVYQWKFDNTWESDGLKIYRDAPHEENLLKRHQTHSKDCEVTEHDFSEEVKCFIVNKSGPVRAIRSYMGATDDHPYMQRTHFFYEKRHDIYTDIRVDDDMGDYYDLLNFDDDAEDMFYINNIDVTAASIDGEANDPISAALYNTTPLEWELMDSPHGSIINVHALITNQDSLIPMGYWNDDDNDYACTSGNVYGNSGMKLRLGNLCTDPFGCPENYVQHRRCMFFDTLGLRVEDASNVARRVHEPPTTQWALYEPCYEPPQLTVLLEGAFDLENTQMNTALNELHLLPDSPENEHPYSVFPWNYQGNEGERFADEPYAQSIVDWLLVSFRTSPDASTEIAKTAALLHNDGQVELLNECLINRLDGNSFYIAIEHRNHVGILTPSTVDIQNGILQYNFNAQDSYTANGTRSGQKQIAPGVWAMYGGEGVHSLIGNDINGDDKAHWVNTNGSFSIYFLTDYNMDGDVNGSDKIIWEENNGTSGALPK